jgi:hypothetical protein
VLKRTKSKIARAIFKVSRLVLGNLGINIGTINTPSGYPELRQDELRFCETVFQKSLTMTSLESLATLALVCKYVDKARVEGAFVEAGVWRGDQRWLPSIYLLKIK